MNKWIVSAALAATLMSATAVQAKNELVLLTDVDMLNVAEMTLNGNGNRLVISQTHTGGFGANTINATINGDLNGGPLGAAFTGPASLSGLQPGSLIQDGFNNSMAIEVNGTSNLFAFSQIGSGNALLASIAGQDNQAAVLQTGVNNFASLVQNGIGNIVSITQNSW